MKKHPGCILLVGSAQTCPDVEYGSGFRAADPVVFLHRGRSRYLVVPELEFGRALRTGRGLQVLTPERLSLRGRRRKRVGDWAAAVVRKAGVRQVTVPPEFPHGVARRLERAGVRVRVARAEIYPERAVKTSVECRKIRESQQAAVLAMRAALAALSAAGTDRNGCLCARGRTLTSEDIRGLITRVLLDHGCLCRETIVAGGADGADPHERGSGPLRAGEPIVLDIFPEHLEHGYWGDLTRTVVRGTASPALRKIYLAVRAAQSAALAAIRPGVACATVHDRAVRAFAQRGYGKEITAGRPAGYIHSTGHGVGLAVHEAPSLSPGNPRRLRAGNVVTVEPGLYYPDVGGVRIEDTVLVTRTGWRYLVPCEKRFEV